MDKLSRLKMISIVIHYDVATLKKYVEDSKNKDELNKRNLFGETAFQVACHLEREEHVDYLCSIPEILNYNTNTVNNAGENVLHKICEAGNLNMLKKLLCIRHNNKILFLDALKSTSNSGWTVFDYICSTGSYTPRVRTAEMLKYLLRFVEENLCEEVAHELITRGNILHLAREHQHLQLVEYLTSTKYFN